MLSSLAACGNSENTAPTFDEFVEKYKRASYDDFLENPNDFLKEFSKIADMTGEKMTDFGFLLSWEKGETETDSFSSTTRYSKSGILFNKGVEFSASLIEHTISERDFSCLISIKFDIGDAEESFELAKTVIEKSFEAFGDASEIRLNAKESTEAELRKAFNTKDVVIANVVFTGLTIYYYSSATGTLYLY